MRKEDINIGRYYNTDTGRGGKFGFGCQSSTDPKDYFGLEEQEPTSITYYADESDVDNLKAKLDKIYDLANVPQEERIYELDGSDDEYQAFHDAYHKYFFETCRAREGNFAGENDTTEREVFTNAHLAQSRLWLGLTILTDIKDEGYCELDAEL